MAQMSSTLLNTKLFIPRTRPDLIPRARLTEQLQTGAWRALTLVSAPAGFGKTTLVADWVRESGWKAAWVSLDEGDNDVSRFLSYLTLALREIGDGIGQTALDILQSSQSPSVEAVLTGLLNEVATLPDDFIVVLDDYQSIVAQPVHDALGYLLEHIPPQMHLVIATRADPPLPLSRLRVRGQMTEVRAADLRFTEDETSAYLNDLMGLGLSHEQIEALEARTEGWIAGLQLAALSMQGRGDKAEFVAAFAGSHRYIIDYLVDEVLSRQSEEVQSFLRQTSVLERFSAPLSEAVTGMSDGQAILQRIEQANLFLVPLDDDRRWFRYHHLFAEFLSQRLQESQPDLIPELHMRASGWFAEEGWIDESIDHAIAGKDYERAASLIEQEAQALIINDQHRILLNWVSVLPGEVWHRHPRLCLYYAMALHATGQLDGVEPLLKIAESNRHLAPHTSVTAYANAIRSYVANGRANYPLAISYAQSVIRSLPSGESTPEIPTLDDDLISRGRAFLGMAEAYMASGELTEADSILSEAIAENQRAGNMSATSASIADRITVMTNMGKLKRAIEFSYQGLDLLRRWPGRSESGGRSLMADAQIYLHVGSLFYEMNELSESETYARRTIEHHEAGGRVHYGIWGYRLLADLMLARGDVHGALSQTQKLDILRTNISDANINLARADVVRMNLRLRIGCSNPELAYLTQDVTSWVEARQLRPDHEFEYSGEPEYLLLARLLIVQDRPGEARPVLERLAHAAESAGRVGNQISYLVTLALAQTRDGEAATGLATLTQALSLAEPEGYVRTFVDCGRDIQGLLQLVAKDGTASNYVSKLLKAFDPVQGEGGATDVEKSGALPVRRESGAPLSLLEPLNERELAILKFMAVGLSNREIASELYLSVNTVRWHAHNLFGKLGVAGRAKAVSRARDLNLL